MAEHPWPARRRRRFERAGERNRCSEAADQRLHGDAGAANLFSTGSASNGEATPRGASRVPGPSMSFGTHGRCIPGGHTRPERARMPTLSFRPKRRSRSEPEPRGRWRRRLSVSPWLPGLRCAPPGMTATVARLKEARTCSRHEDRAGA